MNKEEGVTPHPRGFLLGISQSPLNKLATRLMIALARLIIAVAKLIFSLLIFMFSPPFLNSVYIITFFGYQVNKESSIFFDKY